MKRNKFIIIVVVVVLQKARKSDVLAVRKAIIVSPVRDPKYPMTSSERKRKYGGNRFPQNAGVSVPDDTASQSETEHSS